MSRNLRIAYIAHSLRSDWNNGNAHFLRGLLRAMTALGHNVTIFEPDRAWSLENLLQEAEGERSLSDFARLYPDLDLQTYPEAAEDDPWQALLGDAEVVILHEWNPPSLAQSLLHLRDKLGYRLLFHDTHHRASSSPDQIRLFGLEQFDGVLAFGEVLRQIYRDRFGMHRVWTLHEAADTTIFFPHRSPCQQQDVVWIGNWGDDERSREITTFLLEPATLLPDRTFAIYGVRYPQQGLAALSQAGVRYGGYLPNLDAPAVYAASRLTVHIPRQQYAAVMWGIPTIRVFEALACGIPLLSAPWQDTESLFRPGDLRFVNNGVEMQDAITDLLVNPSLAQEQAARGLETVLARHTCSHRAHELTHICEELLQ